MTYIGYGTSNDEYYTKTPKERADARRKAWWVAMKRTKLLCKQHGLQKIAEFPPCTEGQPQMFVLECGCQRPR